MLAHDHREGDFGCRETLFYLRLSFSCGTIQKHAGSNTSLSFFIATTSKSLCGGFEHGLAPASYKGRFKATSAPVMVAPSGLLDLRALKDPLENSVYIYNPSLDAR